MIAFHNVTKSFGTHDVLSNVSFRINPGENVGVVGLNGAGKSTVFNLLCGTITPEHGDVAIPQKAAVGYLRQQLRPHDVDRTLLDYAENAVDRLARVEHAMAVLEDRLSADESPSEADLAQLGHLQIEFEHLGGYELRVRAETALCGLGFTTGDLCRQFHEFSGGWQMRAELARVLVARPEVLLLDEPTNYLDVPAVEWLHGFLRDFPGTLLLISHDRYLLNALTTVTLEVASGGITRYPGNYDFHVEARAQRREQLRAARANQQRRKEQIERFIERFRSKNTKASQVQSRIKMLEKMADIELPPEMLKPPAIRLAQPTRSGNEVARVENAGFSYDGNQWVFRGVDMRLERGMKAALVAPNGVGKTTLLRVLAGILQLGEGTCKLGHNVAIGYQAQDFTDVMDPHKTVYQTAKEAAREAGERDVRNLLGSFRFSGDAVEKPVDVLSGGEKVRLALSRLLLSAPNFILLDEPTTHLDIPSREALEEALRDYKGTLCFVSHDIAFIRNVATTIFELSAAGLVRYYGDYDYFRQRLADVELDNATAAPAIDSDRKARKRRQAAERQTFAKQRHPLEERARRAETRGAELSAERRALVQAMSAGKAADFAATNRRLTEIQSEIDEATAAWESAELALEELRKSLGVAPQGESD